MSWSIKLGGIDEVGLVGPAMLGGISDVSVELGGVDQVDQVKLVDES